MIASAYPQVSNYNDLDPLRLHPAVHLADGRSEGDISDDDQAFATYCHGDFDHPEALTALLAWAGLKTAERVNFAACREAALDRLADSVDAALDREKLRPLLPGI